MHQHARWHTRCPAQARRARADSRAKTRATILHAREPTQARLHARENVQRRYLCLRNRARKRSRAHERASPRTRSRKQARPHKHARARARARTHARTQPPHPPTHLTPPAHTPQTPFRLPTATTTTRNAGVSAHGGDRAALVEAIQPGGPGGPSHPRHKSQARTGNHGHAHVCARA